VDPAALRAQFPVLDRVVYLNAGTDGPVPRAGVEAARAELDRELTEGRALAHFERRFALQDEQRAAYAGLVGAAPQDVALTTSTSEGIGRVLAGMNLGPGDVLLTSDEEHPGVLGPLAAARDRGAEVVFAPLETLHEAVGPRTTAIVCCHVGWLSGRVAPAALADAGVPLILDGAQGAGAVPVDVAALGCAAYAAAGQKWLCGADGTGFLYVEPGFGERVQAVAPSYVSFEDASAGIDGALKPRALRHDAAVLPTEGLALSAAAFGVLAAAGWDAVHARALAQSRALASRLADSGRTVAPRGDSTLVAWEEADPDAVLARLGAAGIVLRGIPRTTLVRASVGAWTSDGDLDRLLEALG
jgi:L-cysteine/cystine lyase